LKLAKLGPDAVVLDPFAGIGNTLLAAKEFGLSAIGIEIDPAYCAAAEEQLRQAA
jgi:DNA modification methylase